MDEYTWVLPNGLVLSGKIKIEDMKNCTDISLKSEKKLITGYTILETQIKYGNDMVLCVTMQFLINELKYMIIYPDYDSFMPEEYRNQPTLDGTIELEACRKWNSETLKLEEKKNYKWGNAQFIYEQWNYRAGIMIIFQKEI